MYKNSQNKKKKYQKYKKVLAIYLMGIMVASGFISTVNNVNSDGSGNYPPPEDGDWIINEKTYVGNETIELNGNLIIEEGASLTLKNVTVILNCTNDGEYKILVNGGGSFSILDLDNNQLTKFDKSNITSKNPDYEYKFLVEKGAEFVMKNSELSECGYESGDDGSGGLTIKTDNSIIENSNFYNNERGIYLYAAKNSKITNNVIYSNNWEGIYLKDSDENKQIKNNDISKCKYGIRLYSSDDNEIKDNKVFPNNQRGIYIFSSSNNQIINNNFSNNDFGIYLQSSSNNQFKNNQVFSSNFDGAYISSSTDNQIINSTVIDSGRYDFALSSSSSLTIINTTFDQDNVYFDDGESELKVNWYLSIYVVDKNAYIVPKARIRIQDNEFGNYDETYTTDLEGVVQWINLTEYSEKKFSGRTYYTYYNISVDKYNEENSTDIDLNQNTEITIILEMEIMNWIINSTEIYEDTTIILDRNLIIDNGGNLTFKNVTLKMNCEYDGHYRIEVKEGGSFYILGNPQPSDLDLFSGDEGGVIRFYENTGNFQNPSFPQGQNLQDDGGSQINIGERANIDLADLDDDGDYDLFVGDGDNQENSLLFYRNSGTVSEQEWTNDGRVKDNTGSNIGVGYTAAPCFADLDNDGDFDLVIGEWDGPLNYYENTGNPTTPEWTSRGTLKDDGGSDINPGRVNKLDFADYLDDDGDLDMAVGEEGGGINLYKNTGDKEKPIWILENEEMYNEGDRSAPEFVDLNNDGLLDLIVGELDGTLNYRENQGTKAQPDYSSNVANYLGIDVGDRSQPRFYDIDNDWKEASPSIITTNNTDYSFLFWVNENATFVMRNSELNYCGFGNSENGKYSGLWINSDDSILEGNLMTNNFNGIVTYNSDPIIDNNTISGNEGGIVCKQKSNGTLSNNIISSNQEFGIYCNFSNPVIRNSLISNNGNQGIICESEFTIPLIINNTFSDNLIGISSYYESKPIIMKNRIFNNEIGIYCEDTLINIEKSDIYKNNYGIYTSNEATAFLLNSTISESHLYDLYINDTSFQYLKNSNFDRDKISIIDENSNLFVFWYLSIKIVDNNGFGVDKTNIIINDRFGQEKYNGTTNKEGWIKWLEIEEYQEDFNERTEYSPYNITISRRATKIYKEISFNPPNNKSQSITFNLPIVGEQFGFSTSNAGDLNNDGYDDIIVGAPFNDINGFNAGAAYIFYGYSDFVTTNLEPEKANITITGDKNSLFGWSVSNAGDINNDTYNDIIIGAPEATVDGKTRGSAYVFYGKDLTDGVYDYTNSDIIVTGRYEGDKFGSAVSDAGDMNNDTFDDVIVNAYSYEIENGLIGEYYDNNNFTNLVSKQIDNTVDFEWEDGMAHENMTDADEFSVRWTGKIYCPQNDNYIFYMMADDRDRLKIDNFQLFWNADVNSEETYTVYLTKGYHDIFVEMTERSGTANVTLQWESSMIPKQVIGEEYFFHTNGDASTHIFYGPINNEKTARNASITLPNNLVSSISSAGDLNNDGFDDIIAGSIVNNRVYVYYGSNNSYYGDYYINLWDMPQDWESFELDFSSGLNTTANTFGPNNGDDGWDWEKRVYGNTNRDMASIHGTHLGIGDGPTHDSSARIEVEVGNKGDDDDDGFRDSGAWGIQVNLTPEMYKLIERGSRVIISFDWEAFDTEEWGEGEQNGITEEECYVKGRFGNSTEMNYLGYNMYGDSEAEIWGGNSYYTWGSDNHIPFHEFGHFNQDVTQYIESSGIYYLDIGARFNANVQGQGQSQKAHEGIRAYFDNISIKITYDTTIIIDGEGEFGFSVSSGDLNNDSYSDIIIGAPGIDRTYIYYGSKDGISVGELSHDTSWQFQTGNYNSTLVGQGFIKLRYDESENIVKNGWFNKDWDNWSFGKNSEGQDFAGRNNHSDPNGMITQSRGHWMISSSPGEPPTAGFGSDANRLGGGDDNLPCTGMIKSDPFYIPEYVDYLHFWRRYVAVSFNDDEGIYIKLWDADTNEVLDVLDQWISSGGWWGGYIEESRELIIDISEYHGKTVYLTEEIICNDDPDDKAIAQLDDVFSCDKDGNPVYIMKGYYLSETTSSGSPILGVIPEWIADITNKGDITIRIRVNNSVSWEDAQIANNNELLIFDTPGTILQYNITFEAQNNMSTPILYHISMQYFTNNLPTIIDGIEDDKFGYSVSFAGDLNNDKIDDIIIGAPSNDEKGIDAGAAYAFYGNEKLEPEIDTNRAFGMYYGEEGISKFGLSVSNVGKINNETYQKAMVGAPIFENEKGKAYLVGMKTIDIGVMSIDTPKRNELLTPGVEIDITTTIANFGTTLQNNIEVHLEIICVEDSDNNHADMINIATINVGQFKQRTFKWTVPDGYENENYNYLISIYTVITNDMDFDNNEKVTPTIARGHKVMLTCEESYKSVRASESIEYIIRITNTGNLGDDTVDLSAIIPIDWSSGFFYENNEITEIDLVEGEYKEIKFSVQTIEEAQHGYEYTIDVTGLSKNGITFNTIEITTRIKQTDLEPVDLRFFRLDGVEIGIDKHAIADQDTTINATIKNNGDTYATFVTVTFYHSGISPENIIGTDIVEIIYNGTDEETYAEIKWNTTIGDYTVLVEVDTNDAFLESDETNNDYSDLLSVYSTIPSNTYIRWIKVQYKDSNAVENGLVAIKNFNTGEIQTNVTNDKGKTKFIFTDYSEGDHLQIVATNPEIEEEDIKEGTFFAIENIFAYSADSSDSDLDNVGLKLEKHGVQIKTILDEVSIEKDGYANFEIFLKVPSYYALGEETVTLELEDVPNEWVTMLKGDELYAQDDLYKLDVNEVDWKSIDLFVNPPENPKKDNYEANIRFSALPDSFPLPLWYIDVFSPYSITLSTKLSIYNITLEIIDGSNEITVDPGESIIYSLNVKNQGTIWDEISLTYSGENNNWVSISDSNLSLSPGESKIIYISIEVPEDAKDFDKSIVNLWTLSKDGTRSDPMILTTNVYEKKHEIRVSLEESKSDGYSTDYFLKVMNSGDLKENVILEAVTTNNWKAELNNTFFPLEINEIRYVQMELYRLTEEWGIAEDVYIIANYGDSNVTKLILNKPPYARIILKFNNPVPNLITVKSTISTDASFSEDEEKLKLNYICDFGDDTIKNGEQLSYSYKQAKNYNITLIVEDSEGLKDIVVREVIVVNYYSPKINVIWTGDENLDLENEEIIIIETNETLVLDASGSYDEDGFIEKFSWHLGNENIREGEIIYWNYTNPGNYTITLILEDNFGKKKELPIYIDVRQKQSDTDIPSPKDKEEIDDFVFYLLLIIVIILAILIVIALAKVKKISKKYKVAEIIAPVALPREKESTTETEEGPHFTEPLIDEKLPLDDPKEEDLEEDLNRKSDLFGPPRKKGKIEHIPEHDEKISTQIPLSEEKEEVEKPIGDDNETIEKPFGVEKSVEGGEVVNSVEIMDENVEEKKVEKKKENIEDNDWWNDWEEDSKLM